MPLKVDRIKLKNFKSFRGASVPICEGYTTIVGANGSGKSNILDSLIFVLGTSSVKSLRASRLTDLVHHASKDGMAEVTISMVEDGQAHSVTREVDKKGNSVFRFDGKRTTRHQIDDFLSSKNIHPDGHNIIMQGEVTRLIKSTPMQRRVIIDEVAGIAEYDQKKEEAMRELEKVEQKLREATIILGERQGYLQVLAKEKAEAERFLELKEQAKRFKASLVRKELDGVEGVFKGAVQAIEANNEKVKHYEDAKMSAEKELADADKAFEDLNRKIFEESDRRQREAAREVETVRASITLAETQIKMGRDNGEKDRLKKEELNRRISDIGNQIKERETLLDRMTLEEDDVSKELLQSEKDLKKLGAGKFDKTMEEKYRASDELGARIERKKEDAFRLESDMKGMTERLNLKKATIDDSDTEAGKLQDKITEVETRVKELDRKVSALRSETSSKEKALKELYDQEKSDNGMLEKTEKELFRTKERLTALSAKLKTLKSITGLSNAVEAVTTEKSLKGIVGTVADVIKYDPRFGKAVEAAAGSRLFYVITETAADATAAIKHLKEHKIGRVTFIPLDKIKPPQRAGELEEALKNKHAVDKAVDVIDFNPRNRAAVEFVFGDTIIVDDIDGAREIGIGRVRMATMDGDVAEHSGAIAGGFYSKTSGISELKELEQLESQNKSLEGEKSGIIAHLRDLREKMSRLREEKSTIELSLKENEVLLTEARRRLNDHLDVVKHGEGQTARTLRELQGLEDAIKKKGEEKAKLDADINGLLEQRMLLKKELERPEISDAQKRVTEIRVRMEELREKKSKLDVQLGTAKAEIHQVLLAKKKELESELSEISKEIKIKEKQITDLETERNGLIGTLKEKEAKARELASSMTDLFAQRTKLDDERRKIAEKIGRNQRNIDKLKEEVQEKQLEKARTEARYHDLTHEWERLKDVQLIDGSLDELRRGLEHSEAQLGQLTSINMKAIEMYEEYNKEVKLIKERTKTLGDEKESVVALMMEIEKKKVNAFMDTFSALNTYFDKYFREFYPEKGSVASLKLQDPEKPLESGLILEAKPAGKPIKTIELMSGGEKTVTALAFLFGIQAYNPSPFYVLDEVDAALDKPNSERVARMFKKFSRELQLIIVTHNAAVTRESDQIIGVHMAKDGSSVVEVDLKGYAAAGQAKLDITEPPAELPPEPAE